MNEGELLEIWIYILWIQDKESFIRQNVVT